MIQEAFLRHPILITGVRGMLGSDLLEILTDRWGSKGVIGTTSSDLDITNLEQIKNFLKNHSVSYIVNAAAYTDVDKAEQEREKAFLVNVMGPKYLCEAANELGIPVIHFSTDYVFNGAPKAPLSEEDTPSPLTPNYYAETKLQGEKAVLRNTINLVLRVQWLYGKKKERFTQLKNKSEYFAFEDQWGAPTWTRDVSQTVCELILQKAHGLFHFAYDDHASWAQVFSFVCEQKGYSTKIIPKRMSELNLPAKRPQYCVMLNKKLLHQLGRKQMGSWKNSLSEFLFSLKD